MTEKNGEVAGEKREAGLPKPRFGWLALFQIVIIALVVLMAHETRALSGPPMLAEQPGPLAESPGAVAPGPWGGRGWLAALVAMIGAVAHAASRLGLRRHPDAQGHGRFSRDDDRPAADRGGGHSRDRAG